MKKTAILFLIAFTICIFTGTAFANGPDPDSAIIDIIIDDYTKVESIDMHIIYWDYTKEVDGYYRKVTFDKNAIENGDITETAGERMIGYSDAYVDYFYMDITLSNGEVVTTENHYSVYMATYVFSTEDNTLIKQRRSPGIFNIIIAFFSIISAFVATIVIEYVIALAFRLKPIKYVFFANLVSNITMNLIIIGAMMSLVIDYRILVLVLEILVVILESIYYLTKYKNRSKAAIISYTVVANLASWGIYSLASGLIY